TFTSPLARDSRRAYAGVDAVVQAGGLRYLKHMHRRNFLSTLGLLFASPRLRAQRRILAEPQPDQLIADAANGFVAALRPELRRQTELAFDDPKRKDWSNLP